MISENWPKLLEPGLRSIWQQRLTRRESMGKRHLIFNHLDSEKRFEEVTGIGALSDEDWNFHKTRRINYGSVRPSFSKQWEHLEYAKGMMIERRMIDDNLYAGSQLPRSEAAKPVQLADSAFIVREKAAAEVFNLATTASGVAPSGFDIAGPDGVALLSNSHPLFPGSSSVQDNLLALGLDAANFSAARQLGRKFTDDNGNIVQCNHNTLIVPIELEDEALTIRESGLLPGTANNDANVQRRGMANIISWDYLTDTNRWFIVDPMLMEEHLIWFERIPLEFKLGTDFDTYTAKYANYMRYSRGFSDWRWVIGSEAS
jgi:hypothetical protein